MRHGCRVSADEQTQTERRQSCAGQSDARRDANRLLIVTKVEGVDRLHGSGPRRAYRKRKADWRSVDRARPLAGSVWSLTQPGSICGCRWERAGGRSSVERAISIERRVRHTRALIFVLRFSARLIPGGPRRCICESSALSSDPPPSTQSASVQRVSAGRETSRDAEEAKVRAGRDARAIDGFDAALLCAAQARSE